MHVSVKLHVQFEDILKQFAQCTFLIGVLWEILRLIHNVFLLFLAGKLLPFTNKVTIQKTFHSVVDYYDPLEVLVFSNNGLLKGSSTYNLSCYMYCNVLILF